MLNKKRIIIPGMIVVIVVVIIILLTAGRRNQTINQAVSRLFPEREERTIPVVPPQEGAALPGGERTMTPTPEKPALTRLSENPVSGAGFYSGKVRFIEKATGHLYESEPQGENLARLSNTTIPKIFEVDWSPKKDRAILKYLQDDNLRIFSAFFTSSSTQGIYLAPQILTIAVSPNEDRIFYLVPAGTTNSGITASFEDKNKKQIITLPYGDFAASWPAKDLISLTTRPSAFAEGFLYALNPQSGSLKKIFDGVNGLEALWSPKGDKIIISSSPTPTSIEFMFFDPKQKSASVLPIKTLAGKCVWSQKEEAVVYCGAPISPSGAILPDDWLKGKVSFADMAVKINVKTNEFSDIFPNIGLYLIDLIKPFLSEDENFLFFINKTDGTLWSLKIK